MFTLLICFFTLALAVSSGLTPFVRDIARAQGWLDRPGLDRHVHTKPIPRVGGVAIAISFALVVGCAVLASYWSHWPVAEPLHPVVISKILGPAFLIFLLGLYDDLRGASPALKFFVQAVAAALLFFAGFGIQRIAFLSSSDTLQTAIGLPLTIFWVLLITNAFNLIDGLDGLAAGSALFSAVVMFLSSLFMPDTLVLLFSIVLIGVILGFLRFNFHPASIFLGDSGSLFLGFLISTLAMVGSQKSPTIVAVSIPLIALGFPILDVALAVARRFLGGKPIFIGDGDHIHHRLLKRGLGQREAVLLLYAITAGFGLLSLILLHHGTAIALILALTGTGVLLGVQQLRYGEFGEVLSLVQRSARRRQLVANHVAVRHATERLSKCDNFSTICHILQETLEPLGFDGVFFQMLHPNGFSAGAFLPLNYEPDGKLTLSWVNCGLERPHWELRLELNSTHNESWGFVSLVRLSAEKPVALDLNVLSADFRGSLSKAVHRTCTRMEGELQAEKALHAKEVKRIAAVSGTD